MSEFIRVAAKSDLADREKQLIEIDEQLVLLFRVGEKFYCIDDVCTHDGGTLSDGEFAGCEIECPRHGARFDIRSGKAMCMPATQDTVSHEVKVEGEEIFVKLTAR